MKMQKRQFRIGELAKTLGVERFVIRFWEKEFRFDAYRSEGGQRFYNEKDLLRFSFIKKLLYEQGFTIAGAKKQLDTTSLKKEERLIIASHKTSIEGDPSQKSAEKNIPITELKLLRDKLCSLQKILSV